MLTQPAVLGMARLGNFRLGYETAALATVRRTRVTIVLAGANARARVRDTPFTIHDALNDAPNTCALVVESPAPTVRQSLRVTIDSDAPRLLFNGTLQTTDLTYELLEGQLAWSCSAIDDLGRLNERRPFGTFVEVSVTTIAQYLIATFAPGFASTYVQADLPTVSIIFDGAESFSSCLARLATAIGSYYYVEDLVLHLFTSEATDTPDPIDHSHPFLDEPPITRQEDTSQVRTRVYGKGHGEALLADVDVGATILPIADAVMFNAAGGLAIAAVTSDGAQGQRLAYTGVQLGGGGSIIGPAVTPIAAPQAAKASGTGLGAGVYRYAFTYVTAAGETLPSPLRVITTGVLDPPTNAPAGMTAVGSGLSAGVYRYAYTNVTASGETLPSALGSVTVAAPAAPAAPGVDNTDVGWYGLPDAAAGDTVEFMNTFSFALASSDYTKETAASTPTSFTATYNPTAGSLINPVVSMVHALDGSVRWLRLWRRVNGGAYAFVKTFLNTPGTTTQYRQDALNYALSPSAPGTWKQVALGFGQGPTGTTARKLYRTVADGSQLKLLATIADNVTQTYLDAVTDGALGADALTVATALARQVALSGVALGPAGTTARKVYRTVVDGAQLKLQQTLANNSATSGVTDVTADGSLGANAPVADTSGLSTTAGQVAAGSVSLLTSGAGVFASGGGWVRIGQQIVRYAGISGDTLTGIPASGNGALVTTVKYGEHVDVAPALLGVTGTVWAMLKGSPVHVWVQRDDLAAQADLVAAELAQGRVSDGIIEHVITDGRRGEDSLIALCDADLALFSRPLVTVTYDTRDVKTKSGKTITIDLASPPIHETLVIQSVDISELDTSPGVAPRFHVTASNVRFSLDDILRQLVAAQQ